MPSILEMSDDEFLNLGAPAAAEQRAAELGDAGADEGTVENTGEPATTETVVETTTEEVQGDTTTTPEDGTVPPADKTQGQVEVPADGVTPPVKEEGDAANANPDGTTGGTGTAQVDGGTASTEVVPDYKADYEKIMAPFIANGREIKLKNPAEAVQLMQMGANYTRKMQELAPHRRVLTMLQNNKLTDEATLSFLIDLSKGDKTAVQKLLKDRGIDPRDIDVDSDSTYQGGNHFVSDQQVDFQSTVDELRTMDRGQETIAEALKWDQASIDAVGKEPSVLRTIHEQRVSGVYDLVAGEVNRRRTLGQIPTSTPFLQAYLVVGNEMAEQEKLAKTQAVTQPVVVAQPVAVAKTVAQPKTQVANGDKAKAAGSTRSTAANATPSPINPLAEADDDFMKKFAQFQGRL